MVGKTVLVGKKYIGFCYAGYLVRLRFNTKLINPIFLWYVTTSKYFRKLIEKPLRTTVGINNINTSEISNLLIVLPSLQVQNSIAKKVIKTLKEIYSLGIEIENSKNLLNQLSNQILNSIIAE